MSRGIAKSRRVVKTISISVPRIHRITAQEPPNAGIIVPGAQEDKPRLGVLLLPGEAERLGRPAVLAIGPIGVSAPGRDERPILVGRRPDRAEAIAVEDRDVARRYLVDRVGQLAPEPPHVVLGAVVQQQGQLAVHVVEVARGGTAGRLGQAAAVAVVGERRRRAADPRRGQAVGLVVGEAVVARVGAARRVGRAAVAGGDVAGVAGLSCFTSVRGRSIFRVFSSAS